MKYSEKSNEGIKKKTGEWERGCSGSVEEWVVKVEDRRRNDCQAVQCDEINAFGKKRIMGVEIEKKSKIECRDKWSDKRRT